MKRIISFIVAFSLAFLPVLSHAAATNTGFTCNTTPAQILTASGRTKAWLVVADQTNTVTIYVGTNSSVTAARGAANSGNPLNAGNTMSDQSFQTQPVNLWCITASGSGTVVVTKIDR